MEQLKRCPCGCRVKIPAKTLVCKPGWLRVPEPLRRATKETEHAWRLMPTDPVATAEFRAAAASVRSWLALHKPPRPQLVTADLAAEIEASRVAAAWERSQCEACRAPIIWASTGGGRDRIPVDVEPVDARTGSADVKLVDRGKGPPPRAQRVTSQRQMFGVKFGWRDHMKTCPYAEHYRARARRRAS